MFEELTYGDLARLKPKQWLNGELVLTGIKFVFYPYSPFIWLNNGPRDWLLKEHSRAEQPIKVFNTYFFSSLRLDVCIVSSPSKSQLLAFLETEG
jgi:hypothetical protein